MTDRPILFSGPMVRALIEGRKTQTRRVLKPQPVALETRPLGFVGNPAKFAFTLCHEGGANETLYVPVAYTIGDRLYVREAWGVGTRPCPIEGWRDGVEYRAEEAYLDNEDDELTLHAVTTPEGVHLEDYASDGWRPSIHMPRWASRLTLTVTDVRVQRVQDISNADALAEGIEWPIADCAEAGEPSGSPILVFEELWDSLNAKRGFGWDANPWVVAITFEVVQGNIDSISHNDEVV